MKTVIVIPARYASSRLEGKALLPIGVDPMVVRVWKRCLAIQGASRVIVATDDERIQKAVAAAGGEAVMTSPHHQTGTDRIAEAVQGIPCDIVVNVQGDEPFIEPSAVEALAGYFERGGGAPAATLVTKIDDTAELFNPSVVKVVVGKDGGAVYFSRLPVPFRREMWEVKDGALRANFGWVPDKGEVYYRHLGVYAFTREFLYRYSSLDSTYGERAERLEQLRILEHGYRIHAIVTSFKGLGVDTAADLAAARKRAEEE